MAFDAIPGFLCVRLARLRLVNTQPSPTVGRAPWLNSEGSRPFSQLGRK